MSKLQPSQSISQLINNLYDFEDFCILTTNNNDFKVTIIEVLLIGRDYPPLNENKQFGTF